MGDDDVPRLLADVEGNGLARDEEAVALLVVSADEEREPTELDASSSGLQSVCSGRENVGASVAEMLEVESFVARVTKHGPIVAPRSPMGSLDRHTQPAFEAMNAALKQRAEQPTPA